MHIANAKGMRMQVLVPRFQVPVPPWLQVQQSKAQVGEFCSNTYEFFLCFESEDVVEKETKGSSSSAFPR